jgi:hypothetical protein
MKSNSQTGRKLPDDSRQQQAPPPEAALSAVRDATLAIHRIESCSHPAFDALTEAGRELLLGLLFHAIDDTERDELATLTDRADAAKANRDRIASGVTESRRRLAIADEDIRSLERMLDVLEAIARHESLLERTRAAVENQAEYRRFLDSFGDRVLATQAEWCRCLSDIDAAVAAARSVLKREYEEAQRQWTAVEQKVLRP